MAVTLKKLLKLRNRRTLGFATVSFFATIVLATMHPALAQTTAKTAIGNNSMDMALVANILEIVAASLLAVSIVSAIVGVVLQKVFEVIKFSKSKIVYAATAKMSAINFT